MTTQQSAELTADHLVVELIAGRRILYVTDDQDHALAVLERVRRRLPFQAIERVTRTAYQATIVCNTGGRIWFVAATAKAGRGVTADTLVLDTWRPGVREAALPALNGSAAPRVFSRSAGLFEEPRR